MNKKYKSIIVIIIISIVVLIIGYKMLFMPYFMKNSKEIHLDKQISNKQYSIENDVISKPTNGFDFSISFWIYINDNDYNFKYWKHIAHKGNHPDTQLLMYENWDDIEGTINEQNPGLWLHPTINNLRFALTTNKKHDLKNTQTHAFKRNNRNIGEIQSCIITDHNNSNLLEYIDIDNIPIKKMTFISFVLKHEVLSVFYNGKLFKSKKLLGTPETNNGDYYFNFPKTFDGEIYDFKYTPSPLSSSQINILYKNIPNTNRFTKTYRIKNYLSHIKIRKAFMTLF